MPYFVNKLMRMFPEQDMNDCEMKHFLITELL